MIAIAKPSVLSRWRDQIGPRLHKTSAPRPLAALGYLTNGPVVDGLIEVENVVLVVLHDERRDEDRLSLSVSGFSGKRIEWGVQWGGVDNSLFLKNLLLKPRPNAWGRCIDASRTSLIDLALRMDRRLDQFERRLQFAKRREIILPQLWAGFRASCETGLEASGPELVSAAERANQNPAELLRGSRREYAGLALYPLDWVSQHWQQVTAVFADMEAFPETQVVALSDPESDLIGFRGAAQFDFWHSRFRKIFQDGDVCPETVAVA